MDGAALRIEDWCLDVDDDGMPIVQVGNTVATTINTIKWPVLPCTSLCSGDQPNAE